MTLAALFTSADALELAAESAGGKTAAQFPAETVTYSELFDRASEIARALLALGVNRGDSVAIYMVNCTDYIAASFALAMVGAVMVPLSTRLREAELGSLVIRSRARVVLSCAVSVDRIDRLPFLRQGILAVRGQEEGAEPLLMELGGSSCEGVLAGDQVRTLMAAVSDYNLRERRSCVRSRDPGVIIFTSGTTGQPNGAILTHEAFLRASLTLIKRFQLGQSDVVWDAKPFFHFGGLESLLATVIAQATYVTLPFFEPDAAVQQLRESRSTVAWPVFDAIWRRVMEHPDFSAAAASLRSVGLLGNSETLRHAQRRTPNAIVTTAYGATECGPVSYTRLEDSEAIRFETVGHPAPGVEIRIVDPETRKDVGPELIGEMAYRGPMSFDGYYMDPDLTNQYLDEDGWYYSGDLGKRRIDGHLVYVGRVKEMLKVGGENVVTTAVEACLLAHDAVSVAAVVGYPDEIYTEVPIAFVELTGSGCSASELTDFCRRVLPSFAVPRAFYSVQDWPMSTTKIRKVSLQGWLVGERLEECRSEPARMN